MLRFMLQHRHRARECAAAFAARKGSASPLRHPTVAACAFRGHEIWWQPDAASEAAALEQLPPYVAERTTATRIPDVLIP